MHFRVQFNCATFAKLLYQSIQPTQYNKQVIRLQYYEGFQHIREQPHNSYWQPI